MSISARERPHIDKMWNLTEDQWASVLQTQDSPVDVAARLRRSGGSFRGRRCWWNESADCRAVADLGCGRGEHSGVLALAGRSTTLIDWAPGNLAFARQMYSALGVTGQFCRADITRPLPLETDSVDMVFSCGVFEYFNSPQIDQITAEAFRVARKRVIIMVPNAAAIGYRLGKWYMERTGTWEWGGEVPSYSLRRISRTQVRVRFASSRSAACIRWSFSPRSRRIPPDPPAHADVTTDPARSAAPLRQGYLLVTIGEK